MARPKQYNKDRIQMQVRLNPTVRKRLEKEASKRVVSKNFLVERAIAEALDRWEKEEESALVTTG